MMQILRSNTKVIIWILVVAFVGTIVFAWGMDLTGVRGGRSGAPSGAVGRVNGKEIPLVAFNRAADQVIEEERTKNPEKDFTEADYRQARAQTWSDVVSAMLQQTQLDAKGIKLTDPELVDFIRRYPPQEVQQMQDFQTDGKFDYQKYLGAMTDPRYAQLWAQVEALMRSRLTNFKLQEYIGGLVRVSDIDMQDKYLRDNERIKVDYALVPVTAVDANSITINRPQIEEYYNAHQEEFKTTEQAYYTVIKAAKVATSADDARAKEEIDAIKAELDKGADFATLASEKTQDPSGKGKGGDLGWVGRKQMTAIFDSVCFAIKDGEISPAFKSPFGWHIVSRKASRVTDGKEEVNVAHILIKSAASQETVDDLRQKIQAFRDQVGASNYSSLLAQYNLTEETQKKLSKNGGIVGMGRDAALEAFLFGSSANTFSDVYDRPDAFYVYRADRVAPAGIASVDEVSSMIERNLKLEAQKKMTLARGEQIYNAVMSGSSLADAAKSVGLTVVESPFFARTGRLTTIGQDANFFGAAFSLSQANRLSKPVITSAGTAVIEFKEKLTASLDGFSAQRDTLRSQELLTLQNTVWDKWFSKMRDASTIEDFRKEHFGDQF